MLSCKSSIKLGSCDFVSSICNTWTSFSGYNSKNAIISGIPPNLPYFTYVVLSGTGDCSEVI